MTDTTEWPIRALTVRVPAGERRNPVVMTRVAVGPLVLELIVSLLRKGGLTVRPPSNEGGVPAVEAPAEVWTGIERAAIGATLRDQAAREHLFGPDLRQMPRPLLKALREVGVLPSAEVTPIRPAATPA